MSDRQVDEQIAEHLKAAGFPSEEVDTLKPVIEEHLDNLDSLSNQTEELGELLVVAEDNFRYAMGYAAAISVNFAKHLRRISERLDLMAEDLRFLGDESGLALNSDSPDIHSGIENGGQQFEPKED